MSCGNLLETFSEVFISHVAHFITVNCFCVITLIQPGRRLTQAKDSSITKANKVISLHQQKSTYKVLKNRAANKLCTHVLDMAN
jgi:hypothetical protein